jgi:drug/metabolite transporter (DMT)-like permease
MNFPSAVLVGCALTFSLVWSSAFIVGKIGMAYTNPYALLCARFAIAALLLIPVCMVRAIKPWFGSRKLISDALLLGALNNALYLGLSFTALRFISPALVVVIVSCAPFVTTAIAASLRLERLRLSSMAGMVAGFVGVLVITLGKPVGAVDWRGITLAALGMFSFSIATVFYRKRASLYPPQAVNFWQSIAGVLLLLPAAIALSSTQQTTSIPLPLAAATVYLAVVVTIGGMWLWLFLIRHMGAATASSVHLANPFFGLLLSHLVFGTPMQLTDWMGVIVIAAGLFGITHLSTEGKMKMQHQNDDSIATVRNVSVDTKVFFGLEHPHRIKRQLSIELTDHSYLPKADDPRSDWVASVAYPAFVAVQQMDIGLDKRTRFASIGTGAGIDALAAIEVFGCREVAVTDLHADVVSTAVQNISRNIASQSHQISIKSGAGDLLSPVLGTCDNFDLIYENLPNIPLYQDGNLDIEQTSSTYIDVRKEVLPEFISSNLLSLHYLALRQARGCLAKTGAVLSSIGGRIPLSAILNLAQESGYLGTILLYTWKIQSEPEEVIGGYAAWQKRGLGPFYFYPTAVLEEVFCSIDMVAAGDQALEIEQSAFICRAAAQA